MKIFIKKIKKIIAKEKKRNGIILFSHSSSLTRPAMSAQPDCAL